MRARKRALQRHWTVNSIQYLLQYSVPRLTVSRLRSGTCWWRGRLRRSAGWCAGRRQVGVGPVSGYRSRSCPGHLPGHSWSHQRTFATIHSARRILLRPQSFSLLKTPTSTFTIKNLLRCYAKQAIKHSKEKALVGAFSGH